MVFHISYIYIQKCYTECRLASEPFGHCIFICENVFRAVFNWVHQINKYLKNIYYIYQLVQWLYKIQPTELVNWFFNRF